METMKRGRPKELTDQCILDLRYTEQICARVLNGLRYGSEGESTPVRGSAQMIYAHGADGESLTLEMNGKKIIAESGQRISTETAQDLMNKLKLGLLTKFSNASSASAIDRKVFKVLSRPANNVRQVRKLLRKHLPYEVKTEVKSDSSETLAVHAAHSPILRALHERTEEFCQSKMDKRYPKARWSDEARIVYLSRVWAGLSLGLSASYSEKFLRDMAQPSRAFPDVPA